MNCSESVQEFLAASEGGVNHVGWSVYFRPEGVGGCSWKHDSPRHCVVRLRSLSPAGVQNELKSVGDHCAVRFRGRSAIVMTDILGSRPVYVGEKSGRTFVSNRFNLVKECDSVKPVAGSTLLHLTSSGIRISRMRHQSKSEGGGEVNLRESLQEAVRRRVQGKGRVAVSFSGGLDSSTLATLASKTSGVKLFTVYLKGSRDDSLPIDVADRMGLDWKGIPVTEDLVSSCAKSTISSRMWRTRMDYSLGIGFRLVSEAARVEGFDLLLAGQGADELFGGYHKYCALEGKGLKSALSRDQRMLYLGMARDAEAIREGGCQPSFPFLDEDVVLQARRLGVEDYIHKGTVKVALRKVAMELGLPDRVVQGPKKAFQYSSGLQKVVQKLFF